MNAGPGVVVDASVALKWFFPDEEFVREAGELLRLFRNDELQIRAPALIRYEVAQALETGRRQGRITDEEASKDLGELLSLDIHAREDSYDLLAGAQSVARQIGSSVYDGVYVAYAEMLGFSFVTGDEALLRLLEEYPVVARRLDELMSLP